ncbi:2-phosphosulfolactate phosphatase [Streptomyces sp. NPDC088360]|uniref:2-phosphosulfolactate phosphatase n=1 Tax=Streptomyces sp. NPDC088360 TaxID=3154515 RepID=UPI00344E3EA2
MGKMQQTQRASGEEWSAQGEYGVRFEWGPEGARRLMAAGDVACLVVVDVLSFTTAVSVAVDAGTKVFPYAWRDESAVAFAAERDAELAVGRRAVTAASPWSLSPAALRLAPFTPRLVLPSPNGSAIPAAAGTSGTVVAGCLRNAAAVGSWLAGQGYGGPERPVAVVAAGERWAEGSLRPALEDLLGAGAIISAVASAVASAVTPAVTAAAAAGSAVNGARVSPEAAVAAASYASCADVASAVADCASGRELRASGFAEDVAVAVESGASERVPVLAAEGFFSPNSPNPPNSPNSPN